MKKVLFVAALSLFLVAGCGFLERAGETATTPDPALGGKTPAAAGMEAVSNVAFNPANPLAWAQLIQVVAIIAAGGLGIRELKKVSATNAEMASAEKNSGANKT